MQDQAPGASTVRPPSPAAPRTRAGFLKPRALRPGATIALVSPSDPAPARFPQRLAAAKEALAREGFTLLPMPHSLEALAQRPYLAGTDRDRAADIDAAFADPRIDAVWASIGGMNSNRLLDLLDYGAMRRHPKPLIGYSDVTCLLNAAVARAGIVAFHGPNAVVEFGDPLGPDPYTAHWLRRVVGHPAPAGELSPAASWYLEDWMRGGPRRTLPGRGWVGNGRGVGEGPLLGGNLQTLLKLAGTPYWPDFDGAVLVCEDLGLPVHAVDGLLAHLRALGVLRRVSGVVVGKMLLAGGSVWEPEPAIALLEDLLDGRRVPIIAGVDLGHTDPMLTLPLGAWARVDARRGTLHVTEGAVV